MNCRLALVVSVVLSAVSPAQDVTRIALTNSSMPSAEVVKHLSEQCRNTVLTIDSSKAKFLLEANVREKAPQYLFALFDAASGDALYYTETNVTSNAFKDVCEFLKLKK